MSNVQVRLDPGEHQPGREVRGRVVVVAGQKARGLEVRLALIERSPDYVERPVVVPGGRLAEGDLTAGAEYPFSLTLPGDAKPATAGQKARLGWEAEAEVDVPWRRDITASTPLEVRTDGRTDAPDPPGTKREDPRHKVSGLSSGATATAIVLLAIGLVFAVLGGVFAAEIDEDAWFGLIFAGVGIALIVAGVAVWLFKRPRRARGIDLTLAPPTVRRGGDVRWQLTSTGGEGADSVGLVCVEIYDVETQSTDSQGNTTTSRSTKRTRIHEEWVPTSSGIGDHGAFTIPASLPYSHLGRCASYAWFVVARRDRRVGHEQTDVPLTVEA